MTVALALQALALLDHGIRKLKRRQRRIHYLLFLVLFGAIGGSRF